MTWPKPLFLSVAFGCLLSACSHQIETRIEGMSSPLLPKQGEFFFAQTPEVDHPLMARAHVYAASNLAQKGWQLMPDTAGYQLVVTIAERPSDIGLAAQEDDTVKVIAKPGDQHESRSCVDVEHRVTIVMLKHSDGDVVYSGSAAEHHCKARLADTLPLLVNASLEDFGRPGSSRVIKHDGIN